MRSSGVGPSPPVTTTKSPSSRARATATRMATASSPTVSFREIAAGFDQIVDLTVSLPVFGESRVVTVVALCAGRPVDSAVKM